MLGLHLYWIWKAFTELNYRRDYAGMGTPVPFKFSELEAYCRLKGIYSLGERERLLRLIDVLDREWMRQTLEKQEQENPSPTSRAPPSHSPPRGGGTRGAPRKQVI